MSRIRTNLITNRMANGAPTVSHGLVVAGVTTITGSINNLNLTGITTSIQHQATNINVTGVVTATSFVGSGANLTGIDATKIITGNTQVQTIDTGSDGHIKFTTEGSERLRIDSSGRLLVGTTNTTNNIRVGNKFGIVGTVAYTGMSISQYAGTNINHKPLIDFNRSRGTSDQSMTSVAVNDGLGEIIFRGADGNSFEDGAAIRAFVDGTPGDSDMPGRLSFHTSGDGDTSLHERVRITSSGAVMINTTNSSSRTLNLNGTFGILSTNQSGVIDMSVTDAGEASIGPYVAGGSTLILKTNASGSGVAERVRITSTGNVGINESSPTSQLVVRATTDDNPALALYRNSTGGDIAAIIWKTAAGDQGMINYRGGSGTEGMQFYAGGAASGNLAFRIGTDGKLYKSGNHFYPLVNYSEYPNFSAASTSSSSYVDLRTILSGYTPKKAGNIIVIHHQSQCWQGNDANANGDAMWKIQKQEGGGSWTDVIVNERIMGNMDGRNYTGGSGLSRHHRTVHLMGSFECAGTSINLKTQGKVDFTGVGLQWYHHSQNILQIWEYEKG